MTNSKQPQDAKKKAAFSKQQSIVSEDYAEVDPDPDTEYRMFLEKTYVEMQTHGIDPNQGRGRSHFAELNRHGHHGNLNKSEEHQQNELVEIEKYSTRYRFVKTVLLIFTFISFGLNFEMVGPTFEDLRVLYDLDYSRISFVLVLRNIGYFMLTFVFGLVLHKLGDHHDLIIAAASVITALSNFLTPIASPYFLLAGYFLIQGFAQSIYDLVGNTMILDIWSGISSSPIIAVHAGYGIGAILAVQIARPFIKIESRDGPQAPIKQILNETLVDSNAARPKILQSDPVVTLLGGAGNETTSPSLPIKSEIGLKVPYWIAASFSCAIAVLFVITYSCQVWNQRSIEKKKMKQMKLIRLNDIETEADTKTSEVTGEDDETVLTSVVMASASRRRKSRCIRRFHALIFGDKKLLNIKFVRYTYVQILLFIFLFMLIQGYITILTRFMQTYLTKGPAKLEKEQFSLAETLFWSFFIFGRFFSSYVAFRMDSCKFYIALLALNTFFLVLLMAPYFIYSKAFMFTILPLIGLVSGPLVPGCLMVAKNLLNFSSFVLSLFIMSMAVGGIIFQQLTGGLLDHLNRKESLGGSDSSILLDKRLFGNTPEDHVFNAAYIVPHLSFVACAASLMCFIPINYLYTKYGNGGHRAENKY